MILVAAAAGIGGCAYDSGFGFPAEAGDIAAGRQAFIDHQCQRCHSVAGVELPRIAGAPDPFFELGGETSIATSYEELTTAIINPDHVISERYRERLLLDAEIPLESPMPVPNLDNMTVNQLIDIVAFLDSRYVLIEDYASYQ